MKIIKTRCRGRVIMGEMFKPDYLCNDPDCPSREVIMDLVKEYQEHLEQANIKLRKAVKTFRKIKESEVIPIGKNATTLIKIDNICDKILKEIGEID